MRASLRRALLPVLLVLALVGVVAIASGGSVAHGTNRARTPPDVLYDTVLTLAALALVPAAILLVYGLMQRREVAEEYSRRRRRVSNTTLIVLLLLVPALVYFHGIPKLRPSGTSEPAIVRGRVHPTTTTSSGAVHEYEPHFAWLPALAVVVLAGTAALAWYLASRRRAGVAGRDPAATEALADVLDDTLDDLRAEPDPRRAVIAAYARLERALAAYGIPRRAAETPEELLERALAGLDVSASAIRRLTELFERARFSQHDVDVEMKEEAIAALEQVRDELREAAERAAAAAAAAAAATRPLEGGA